MSRYRLLVAVLCVVGVLVGLPGGRSQETADMRGDKPILTMYGRNSEITKQRLLRITTAEDWRALWLEHKTGSLKPKHVPGNLEYAEPDFEKAMAIAVFEGAGSNCAGYSAHSINEIDGRIVVQLNAHNYQSGPNSPDTQAWGVLILPRSNKEVVLQHDVRSLIADPPKWEEWARFPALPHKER